MGNPQARLAPAVPPFKPKPFRTLASQFAALATSFVFFRPGASGVGGAMGLFSFAFEPHLFFGRIKSQLRRSLMACTGDGIFAEVITSLTTGTVLTAWALHLGGSPFLVGLLGAIPFLTQLVHLPAAWITSHWGYRRVALFSIFVSRQVYWGLVPLPFLPLSTGAKQLCLVGVALLNGIFGVVGNNSWVAWMGDLVPRRLRGRYFGQRNAMSIIGGTVATFIAAVILDGARSRGRVDLALAVLAGLACLSGFVTAWCLHHQHAPHKHEPTPISFRAMLKPFFDPATRPLLVYMMGWNAAVALAAVFIPVLMITYLKMNFILIAVHGVATAFFRVSTSSLWGRALDRLGARPILVFCSFGLAAIPFIWLIPHPGFLWPVVLDAALGGSLWAGHAIAVFSLPLTVAPKKGRPYYLAAFTASGGICYALTAIGGGAIAAALPSQMTLFSRPLVNLHILFIASGVSRLIAALLSLKLAEPNSAPVSELSRLIQEPVFRARDRAIKVALQPLIRR